MRTDYEEIYHALEDTHWWFRARRDMILRLTRALPRDARILEVGCSSGPLLAELQRAGFPHVWGIDISDTAVALACERVGVNQVRQADAVSTGFDADAFDVVIASDILEHITDDRAAIREWRRILKPGGRLILFVPCHPFLWTAYDEENEHVRRYRRLQIKKLVEDSRFLITRSSYWNIMTFPPIALVRLFLRLIPRLGGGNRHQMHRALPILNTAVVLVLKLENILISWGFNAPMGVSFFIIAKKMPGKAYQQKQPYPQL